MTVQSTSLTSIVAPLPIGSTVDGFTVDAVLASGARSIIYRAVEAATGSSFLLREFVPPGTSRRSEDGSLGLVNSPGSTHGEVASVSAVARFIADSAMAATLHHPGLARVSRWFKANGTAYLVFPWQPGNSLQARMTSAPLNPATCLSIARPVLEALDFLHQKGIAHREVAPELVYLGAGGGAVLLGPGSAAPKASTPGQTAAHSPYAAIEEFQEDGAIGTWTDVYALAAILYHCFTGKAPPSAADRAAAIGRSEPDPLPALPAAPQEHLAQGEITRLIERGLILEPQPRPQTVREWRARILRATIAPDVNAKPKAAKPTTEQPTIERPTIKRWLRYAPQILVGVLLLGVVAAGYYLVTETGTSTTTAPPGPDAAAAAAAVAAETERWRQALEAHAVITYREFIKDFPQSINVEQAKEFIDQLEDLAWQDIVAENTEAGFIAHLENFPEGRHAAEAKAHIEEFRLKAAKELREREERTRQDNLAWETARAKGTLGAIDSYLAAWPGGMHVEEARSLRGGLQAAINDKGAFDVAAKAHTIAAYRTYIAAYPGGRHAKAAQDAIESLTLRVGRTFRDCGECPEMVVVPDGTFWQGSSDVSTLAISIEKPRRRVTIAEPFAVSVHEITMAEWDACVAVQRCETRPEDNGWGRGNRPVIMVSWDDALQYSSWLSAKTGQDYSLPSESEWEYLARGGEESDWLGGESAAVCAYANIAGNETALDWRHRDCADVTVAQTAPVGSYKANSFGVYDVVGNVAEWTLDCMNLSYLEAPTDGSAWSRGMCSSRMTRGGSWFTGTKELRLPARFNLRSGDRNDFTGFRLVRRVELPRG